MERFTVVKVGKQWTVIDKRCPARTLVYFDNKASAEANATRQAAIFSQLEN